MAIKSVDELKRKKMQIDLTGEQGNAYCLLGIASSLAKQLGLDDKDIRKK